MLLCFLFDSRQSSLLFYMFLSRLGSQPGTVCRTHWSCLEASAFLDACLPYVALTVLSSFVLITIKLWHRLYLEKNTLQSRVWAVVRASGNLPVLSSICSLLQFILHHTDSVVSPQSYGTLAKSSDIKMTHFQLDCILVCKQLYFSFHWPTNVSHNHRNLSFTWRRSDCASSSWRLSRKPPKNSALQLKTSLDLNGVDQFNPEWRNECCSLISSNIDICMAMSRHQY